MDILICVPDRVVEADLSEWGRELGAAFNVSVLPSLLDLVARAAQADRIAATLVGGARDAIETSGLDAIVSRKGGRLIWLGDVDAGQVLPAGWIAVSVPYSTDTLEWAFRQRPDQCPT